MKIKEAMEKDVATVSPNASIFHATQLMARFKTALLVVADHHQPVGLLSAKEICTKVIAKDKTNLLPVKEVMLKKVLTKTPQEDSVGLIQIMKEEKVPLVVVVNKNNKIVGSITYDSLIHHLVEEVEFLDKSLHHKNISLKDYRTKSEQFMHEIEDTYEADVAWHWICKDCRHTFLVKEGTKKKNCPLCKSKKIKVKR